MRRVAPGPRGLEVLQFLGLGTFENTLHFLRAQARKHGPVTSFRILGRTLYLLDDPELLRQVLVVQQHSFTRPVGTQLLRDITGLNLATTDEPLHRERRRLLQPAFARQAIAAYGGVMAHEARRFAAECFDGQLLDIGAAMARLTLNVASRTLFGGGVDPDAYAMSQALARAMHAVSRVGPILEAVPPSIAGACRRLSFGANVEFRRARTALRASVQRLIERNRGIAETNGGGVLSIVLAASGDDAAVGDELCALLFAGHETTATALTWAWYLLASHPTVEATLHEELDAVLGERDPTVDDIANLPFTTAVFNETLRLYPSAPVFGRRVLEDCELCGYRISGGSGIIISPFVSQRNARYFPAPECFVPARWQQPTWPDFAYVPFGGGARRCIGEPFARMEGVMVLATLARRYRFARIERGRVGIASAMLRPARPIVVRAIARDTSTRRYVSVKGESLTGRAAFRDRQGMAGAAR
ncbi:MAG: cytochrome P450 [Candidatus Eremiobacteraeota bacterium]|nr:cytochrome P450 [Candidatus Eremiobacteraeota bacterium]MBC5801625.1 cytochrome P450 [Candidatus Eremiobacteraeota bacterium]